MTFANASPPTSENKEFSQDWWPDICLDDARNVIRVSDVITNDRLIESIQNAIWSVNNELSDWAINRRQIEPAELTDERLVGLYKRAVYSYAKAELVERYRDYDMTAAGARRADDSDGIADEMRRNLRWAISDILGQSRVTIESM